MNMLLPSRRLHLLNRTGQPARVRLLCANRMAWEVWLPAMGAVAAPPFAPTQVSLQAKLTDPRTHVTYLSRIARVRPVCSVMARMEQLSGAGIFVLEARDANVANALQIINQGAGSLDFVARYHDSPYRLTGFVKPGGVVQIAWALLDLVVVQNGFSVQQRLPGPEGIWAIDASGDAAGFPVIGQLDANALADAIEAGA
jgi:hypothetical protein